MLYVEHLTIKVCVEQMTGMDYVEHLTMIIIFYIEDLTTITHIQHFVIIVYTDT